jgi:hypothetical protein
MPVQSSSQSMVGSRRASRLRTCALQNYPQIHLTLLAPTSIVIILGSPGRIYEDEKMPQTQVLSAKDELIERCLPFLEEIKDMTPGKEVEQWINRKYGPNSRLYKDLARLIRIGVEDEGWAANIEIDGRRYRRSRLVEPSEKTSYFSITTAKRRGRPVQTGEVRGDTSRLPEERKPPC